MSKATKLGQHYQCFGRVNILVLKHEDPCRPGQSADTHTQHSMLKDGTRQSTTTNGAEQLHTLGYRQCRIVMTQIRLSSVPHLDALGHKPHVEANPDRHCRPAVQGPCPGPGPPPVSHLTPGGPRGPRRTLNKSCREAAMRVVNRPDAAPCLTQLPSACMSLLSL